MLGVLNAKQVNPHLFSLVFGESAFNDAVAIVLFRTFSRFVRTGAQGGALLDEATCVPTWLFRGPVFFR